MVQGSIWKQQTKESRFGIVFISNFTVFWECACLVLFIVCTGTNSWYVREDKLIPYVHGGLWNECMGDIDRTFCSPTSTVPVWLQVCRAFSLLSIAMSFLYIIYVMVGMARKNVHLSIMFGFSNFAGILLFVCILVYTAQGFSTDTTPSTSYIIAWVTLIVQAIESGLCFYAIMTARHMSRKQSVETGLSV